MFGTCIYNYLPAAEKCVAITENDYGKRKRKNTGEVKGPSLCYMVSIVRAAAAVATVPNSLANLQLWV